MPYITREDGERFIIPSYRDILSAKKTSLLKKEILLLSTNYGEYIALQRKNANQYEVAFSPDAGYLLGECVWNYFKRPYDMIYCEAIPNTNEAILVIVKSGSVYLDGSFPVDSIPEELVIFKTQQNNFSIFISGDVPISETPEEGKFSFDASSVRSFQILEPIFPTLPGVKAFQLQLVDNVLRQYGIGVIPVKKIGIVLALGILGLVAYDYITTHQKEIPVIIIAPSDPYQSYTAQLSTPDLESDIATLNNNINFLYTIPGWFPDSVVYTPGTPSNTRARLMSLGARMQILLDWAQKYNEKVEITSEGIFLTMTNYTARRNSPNTISSMQDIIANIIDRLSYVLPGNNLQFSNSVDKRVYKELTLKLTVTNLSPVTLDLIGRTLQNLPLVLSNIDIKLSNEGLSGIITFKALGN